MTSTCEKWKSFSFMKIQGSLVLYIYLHFSSVIKKIHSETLLCFHSAHQESLNRRRSHSSRPIPWDILNFQILKNLFKLFFILWNFSFQWVISISLSRLYNSLLRGIMRKIMVFQKSKNILDSILVVVEYGVI